MNTSLRSIVKIPLLGALFLVLMTSVFGAGFGSAYILTGAGVLPWPQASPPPTQLLVPTGQSIPTGAPTELPSLIPTLTPTLMPTPAPIPTLTNGESETFQLFWEVWGIVQRDFYGELPDETEMTYAAIRGMLNSLNDPYTAFIEPEAAAIQAEDATGEYEGIGAYVDLDEEGRLLIIEPFEGSPAEEAGLLPDDRIIAVDGVSTAGLTLYEAIGLVRGPAGTEVTLLVERDGVPEPFEVTVTRAHFEIEITQTEMLDNDIGYIRLREFSATAGQKMQEGLEKLLAQNPRGIILDLRYNPGGWLDQAVEVSDLFLDGGVILTQRWKDGSQQVYKAHPGEIAEDIPLVVLVDRGTASAAEIVSGALQDQGRAILIGETTFGKGAVQLVYNLSDGSQLLVTSALWFTPNNQPIHGNGLTPDIEVLWPEELEEGEDPMRDRAIEYFLTGK
jgi:carboxyl-terminal processing protease